MNNVGYCKKLPINKIPFGKNVLNDEKSTVVEVDSNQEVQVYTQRGIFAIETTSIPISKKLQLVYSFESPVIAMETL